MKSASAMRPTMRFSMGSEPFAEADVEGGHAKEGQQQHYEHEVVHGWNVSENRLARVINSRSSDINRTSTPDIRGMDIETNARQRGLTSG